MNNDFKTDGGLHGDPPFDTSTSPERKQHLVRVIRLWLSRAQQRVEKRDLDLVPDAIRRANEALDMLEKVL